MCQPVSVGASPRCICNYFGMIDLEIWVHVALADRAPPAQGRDRRHAGRCGPAGGTEKDELTGDRSMAFYFIDFSPFTAFLRAVVNRVSIHLIVIGIVCRISLCVLGEGGGCICTE